MKGSAMEFRQSRLDDIDDINAVFADGRASLRALGIDQWQNSYPTPEIVRGDIEQGHGFVAVDEDGSIVGIASALFIGEKIYDDLDGPGWLTDSLSHEPRYCTIHRVAVSAQATGKGVGRFMIESIEALARENGSESVRVDTHRGNAPMRNLLLKCGYTECGVVHVLHVAETTTERIAYEKLIEQNAADEATGN
ncbi:GNAT family N-acetyltransferase [Eggerthellaceae bacterium zg-887]|nr:GNAT family N-acetyltransferase [Xiamenia xianingshaonis]